MSEKKRRNRVEERIYTRKSQEDRNWGYRKPLLGQNVTC